MEDPDAAMDEMGIDPQDIVDEYVFQTGEEDPQAVSERVYNEVEQQVLDATDDFETAQEVAAEASEQAMQYAEQAYGS